MALAASRSLWEAATPDVYVDLVGIQSNHGSGIILVDIDVVTESRPETGGLSIIRGRRRRPRPRFVIPDEPAPPQLLPDTVIDLAPPPTKRGVGLATVETDFFLTEEELVVLMALIADK